MNNVIQRNGEMVPLAEGEHTRENTSKEEKHSDMKRPPLILLEAMTTILTFVGSFVPSFDNYSLKDIALGCFWMLNSCSLHVSLL